MRRNHFILTIFTFMVISLTNYSQAFYFNYGVISGYSTSSTSTVYIRYANNSTSTNFICNIYTTKCDKSDTRYIPPALLSTLSSSSKEISDNIKKQTNFKNYNLTFSNNQNYLGYVRFSTSTGYREIVLRNNIDGAETVISTSTRKWDILTEHNKLFLFNSDDTRLYYLDDINGVAQLFYIEINNPQDKILISANQFMVDDFVVYSTSTVLYNANNKSDEYNWILYVKYNNGKEKKVLERTAHNMGVDIVKGRDLMDLYTLQDFNRIPTIIDLSNMKVFKYKNDKINKNIRFVKENIVRINKDLSGIFIDSKKATKDAIIWLHGGPYRQTGFGLHSFGSYAMYESILQEAAKSSVDVIKLDYHGGFGKGVAFADNLRNNVGNIDVKDVRDTINYLKKKGYKNITLMGTSYGGYLALRYGLEEDATVKNILVASPVTDWYTIIDKDPDPLFGVHFSGKPTTSNMALYDLADILKSVDKLQGKNITIIHGTKDVNVSYKQSKRLVEALDTANIDHTFITLDNEPHVYAKPISKEIVCESLFLLINRDIMNNDKCKAE